MDDHQDEEERIDRELVRTGDGPDPFSAAVRATRMPMLITDPRQADNPIVFVNNAFLRLTGYSRDEVIGQNCRFLQGPGTNRDDVAKVRAAVSRMSSIEIDLLNYRKDGTSFWNRLLLSPVFHDEELTYFFASQFDVTREKQEINALHGNRDSLEEELRSRIVDVGLAEERLRFTLRAGKLGFWTLDLKTNRLVASPLCKQNFGRQASATFTFDDLNQSIAPEHLEAWRESLAEALLPPGEMKVEYKINTPDEEQRWIELRGQTAFDSSGTPHSMSGVSIDISERKQAEEHRNLLARELNHRVKNSLATVQAIFGQTLKTASTIEEARQAVSSRIQALAGAQDVLIEQGWTRSELSHVLKNALRPFEDGHDRIHYGGPRVAVSAAATTAFSLALHELATNALKYGALSNERGRVAIEWQVEKGQFNLTWRESGGPPVSLPQRRGFGSTMIERALASSVQGTAEIAYPPTGVVFRVTTELRHLRPEEL